MKPLEESFQGAIYSATQICRKSLSECIEVEELMQNEWAENRLADFNLWASGLGASVQGRASLDARLALRPDARDAVANLLQVLTDAIEGFRDSAQSTNAGCDQGATGSDSEDPPRSFSPWSEDSESDSELEATLDDSWSPLSKAKETVNSILDLLVRIAITIRRSGSQSRLRKADRKFKVEEHDELQRHLVVVMLSQGPFSSDYTFSSDQTDTSKLTPIQWRLINCNLKRRNRFLYAQQHSKALDTPANSSAQQDAAARPEVQNLPARPVSSMPVQKLSAKSVAIATSASGITDLPAALPALPKGPVSSHATRTQLSTTVIKLPYPRPPKVGDDAMVFICPCCCQTLPVGILETSRWNPEMLYVTKKAWESHLRDDHGSIDMWTCFACLDSLQFEAEDDFVAHTLQEHGETISEGQIHSLAAACKTSLTAEITSCPLCAWQSVEEGEVNQTALVDHVAEHVHAFSLRALPWAPDEVHEIEAGIQKAVTKVEPWLTKHNLTSETLTVIESSIPAPVPSSPAPHYFDAHDYFAEDSDNSSCSTVSDGTIERELREGQSPVFREASVESDYKYDEAEPDSEDNKSQQYVSRSHYKRGRFIGTGSDSAVWEVEDLRVAGVSDAKFARKTISKTAVIDNVHRIYQEVELLQYVRHPNIVKCIDFFESKSSYYILTDLAEGDNLDNHIVNKGHLSESDTQRRMRDIVESVEYLHYHGIVHRHLAPHKFGCSTQDKNSRLILLSLAHADWERTEERYIIPIYPLTSTPKHQQFGVIAPEIIRREYSGKPADMWSIGAIAYVMLVGYSPFRSEDLGDLIVECTTRPIIFHSRYWKDISDFAKDFIRRLLQPKPEDRLTIEEAKHHPWISGIVEMTQLRGRLVRARWKCVILKVQLALQIQQLPTQQAHDKFWDNFYERTESGWRKRYMSDPGSEYKDFLDDYRNRCQKPFGTAVLAQLAIGNLERLTFKLHKLDQ
ncbi:calcium calmodulin-dependent kinase [Fusarium mundagurra]|uniref:Calcium calmodulin-dependent kinase n=1 Tax=Fusarium mundagurra TaxID=1567541 RepID=A0A8H5XUR1_9HYPO|nr:calcium calmodulin-dependent kinase [Fusarium mundagurra]